jgi:hypothetical protein
MSSLSTERTRSPEPIRTSSSEQRRPRPSGRPALVGRVRLPLAGPYRPWARLYRLPDGRLVWTVRLWHVDGVVRRVVETATLRRFAAINRFPELARAIDALVAAAVEDGRAR